MAFLSLDSQKSARESCRLRGELFVRTTQAQPCKEEINACRRRGRQGLGHRCPHWLEEGATRS